MECGNMVGFALCAAPHLAPFVAVHQHIAVRLFAPISSAWMQRRVRLLTLSPHATLWVRSFSSAAGCGLRHPDQWGFAQPLH
jgi:hypothetical protein